MRSSLFKVIGHVNYVMFRLLNHNGVSMPSEYIRTFYDL